MITTKEDALEALREEALKLEQSQPQKPARRRLFANDATYEAKHQLMTANHCFLLVQDELSPHLARLRAKGNENERALTMVAQSGDQPFNQDRMARGHVAVANACMSIMGGFQPDKVKEEVHQSAVSSDGMLQRFQVMCYPDDSTEASVIDELPNYAAETSARAQFQALLDTDFSDAHHKLEVDPVTKRPYMHFAPGAAQEVADDYQLEIEKLLVARKDHPLLLEHFSKYRGLMPSLALIFQLIDFVEGKSTTTHITEDNASLAVRWCRYLESHARRIYALHLMPQEPVTKLAALIKAGALGKSFRAHTVYSSGWAHLDKPAKVEAACEVLEARHWLRKLPVAPGPQGGRPTVEYLINPKVLASAGVDMAMKENK